MTTNLKAKDAQAGKVKTVTKHQRVIDLLSQDNGASVQGLSPAANWFPHSTRALLTGLKKRDYGITSEKVEAIRRYHVTSAPSKSEAK